MDHGADEKRESHGMVNYCEPLNEIRNLKQLTSQILIFRSSRSNALRGHQFGYRNTPNLLGNAWRWGTVWSSILGNRYFWGQNSFWKHSISRKATSSPHFKVDPSSMESGIEQNYVKKIRCRVLGLTPAPHEPDHKKMPNQEGLVEQEPFMQNA